MKYFRASYLPRQGGLDRLARLAAARAEPRRAAAGVRADRGLRSAAGRRPRVCGAPEARRRRGRVPRLPGHDPRLHRHGRRARYRERGRRRLLRGAAPRL